MLPENNTHGRADNPRRIIRCAGCGKIYTGRESDHGLYPVGTDGTCVCGNSIFEEL